LAEIGSGGEPRSLRSSDEQQGRSRALRVQILSTYEEPCGIAAHTAHLRAALARRGADVSVHPIERARLAKQARIELLPYFSSFTERLGRYDAFVIQHEFGFYGGSYGIRQSNQVFARLLLAVQKTGKPVLVIFHSPPLALSAMESLRRDRQQGTVSGGAMVFAALAAAGRRASWKRVVGAINRGRRTAAVVLADDLRRRLIDSGMSPAKLSVIRHGIGAVRPPAGRPHPGGNDRAIDLTIFGFIAGYKGYEIALRALLELPDEFRLVVAGGQHPANPGDRTLESILSFLRTGLYPDGVLPPLPEKERRTVPGRLAGRVEITGYLPGEQVDQVLERTAIVLAPYLAGGPAGSAALAWALTSQRPIVATAIPAFREINEQEPCLLLTAPQAPHALAQTIGMLAADPALAAKLVDAAWRYAARHGWDDVGGAVLSLLERLAA
jgi:glycosyltransferase involved in cell wall biosynthesis